VALRDDTGSYHVAIIGSQALEIGALIDGPSPRPGYSVLRSVSTGLVVRIIFMATDSTQDAVLDRLHPRPTWHGAWGRPAPAGVAVSGRLGF
jgi:hypothetical protein